MDGPGGGGCLALGACSDDSSDDDGGSSREDPGADLTGEPVELMVTASGDEGTELSVSNVRDGAQVAADAVEAAGGINGRPVEIVWCPHGFDPNAAAACARQAVEEEVLAVVGAFTTFGDNYVPVLEEAGIPTVAPFAISFPEFTSELSYPIMGGAPSTTAGMGAQLVDIEDASQIGVAYLDVEQGALAASLVEEGLRPRDASVVVETPVPQETPDYGPAVAAVSEGDVDGIAAVLAGDDAPGFIQTARQSGVETPIAASSSSVTAEEVEVLGEAAEGLQITSNFKPVTLDDPGVEQFLDEVEEWGPDLKIDDPSMNSWAGVHLVADVLEGAPDQSAADLVAALNVASDVALGIVPPISFDQPAPPLFGGAISRIFNPNVMYAQVENGEIVAITGEFVNPFEAP